MMLDIILLLFQYYCFLLFFILFPWFIYGNSVEEHRETNVLYM